MMDGSFLRPPKCTSLLLRCKPVQRNYLPFFQKFLRVNENSSNVFILDLPALRGEKKSKFDGRILFGAS